MTSGSTGFNICAVSQMGSFINITCTTDKNVMSKEATKRFLDLIYDNLIEEIERSKLVEGKKEK